jgi:hypothetical protein
MKTKVSVRHVGDVAVVDVTKGLISETVMESFYEPMCQLVDAGEKRILLNLNRLGKFDKSGLARIFWVYAYATKKGAVVRLYGVEGLHQAARDLLKFVFTFYESEEQAIASFGPSSTDS